MLQFFLWNLPTLSLWTFDCLLSIHTTSHYLRHENLLHSSHKNKDFWRMSIFFHRPKTMELIGIWCPPLTILTFFSESTENLSFQICIWVNIPLSHMCVVFACACLCACIYIFVCVCVCTFFFSECTCMYTWKLTSVIHMVLVNVSSQYAYLITCLCTLIH